jgi:hypothetical protein
MNQSSGMDAQPEVAVRLATDLLAPFPPGSGISTGYLNIQKGFQHAP